MNVSPVQTRVRASDRRGPWAMCPEIIQDSSLATTVRGRDNYFRSVTSVEGTSA